MLIPPNRHSSAIMADSLLPKDRKKQLMQEITLEPAGGGAEGEKTEVRESVRMKQRLSFTAKQLNRRRKDSFTFTRLADNRGG